MKIGKNRAKRGDKIWPMQIKEQLVKKKFSLIPLKGKEAIIKWKKYQYQRATIEEILDWYVKFGDINLGIVTGKISNLAIIDVDDVKQLLELEKMILNLWDTFYVITKRGYHFYFFINGVKISNTKKLFNLPGVELSVNGRYVVAPGSKVNGHLYKQAGSLNNIKQLPEVITGEKQLSQEIYNEPVFKGEAKCISQILRYDIPEGKREIAYFIAFSKLSEAKNKAEYSRYLIKVANGKLTKPLPEKEIEAFKRKKVYHYSCPLINKELDFIDCSNCKVRGGFNVSSLLEKNIMKIQDLTTTEKAILAVLDSYFRGSEPEDKTAWEIQKYTGMNYYAVKKAMEGLKEKGIIE